MPRDREALLHRFDLDDLERRAVEAITRCYDISKDDMTACFWVQKGIEGMRLAVAEAIEATTDDMEAVGATVDEVEPSEPVLPWLGGLDGAEGC